MNILECNINANTGVAYLKTEGLNPLNATTTTLVELQVLEIGAYETRVFALLGIEYLEGPRSIYQVDLVEMPVALRKCSVIGNTIITSNATSVSANSEFNDSDEDLTECSDAEVPECLDCDQDDRAILRFPPGTFSSNYIWFPGAYIRTNLGVAQIESIEASSAGTVDILVKFSDAIESCEIDFDLLDFVVAEYAPDYSEEKKIVTVGEYFVIIDSVQNKVFSLDKKAHGEGDPTTTILPNGVPTAVAPFGSNSCFIGTDKGIIYRFYPLTDRHSISEGGAVGRTPIRDIDTYGDHIAAVGDNNVIKYSDDGGVTWRLVLGPNINSSIINVFVTDLSSIFVVEAAGRLYFTENLGVTWTYLAGGPSEEERVRKVVFYTKTIGFYITTNKIYRTTDGGRVWILEHTSALELTDIDVRSQNRVRISCKDSTGTYIIDGVG